MRMEARRILWNKKSMILLLLFFVVNTGLFYDDSIRGYVPRGADEIHKVDFTKKQDEVRERIEGWEHVPIFQHADHAREDEKMLRDYGRLVSVRGTTHRAEGISLWFAASTPHYLTLLFCLWLVFITFETEKSGLFPLVYAAKSGRFPLALRRLRLYLAAALGGSVLFGWPLLAIACLKTGNYSALWQPVQLVAGLENRMLPVNGITFVLLVTALSAFGIFAVVLLFWMFLLLIHNQKIALTVCGLLFAAEYFFFRWIPEQSRWSLLKYINIMTMLDLGPLFADYRLYTVGPFVLERMTCVCAAVFLLAGVLAGLCFVLSVRRRPFYQKQLVERVIEYTLRRLRAALCGMPGRCWEWYKMLVPQRGLFVIVFFLAVLIREVWQPASAAQQITLGSEGEYMADFYEQWEGPVTEQVWEEIQAREEQLEMLIEQGNPASGYYAAGLRVLHERMDHIEKNGEKGLWLVDPGGYEYILGRKGEEREMQASLLVLLCLAALIAGIVTFERKSGMEYVLRTARYGRNRLQKRKYAVIVSLTVLFWLVANGMELYHVRQTYPLGGFSAPVESLPFMEQLPFSVSIGMYCMLVYGVRLLWLLVFSLLYTEAARWCSSQEIGILICSFTLLPSILYLMGMEMFSRFAVVKLIHVSHFFRQGYGGIGKQAAAFILTISVLCISVRCHSRR